MPATTARAWASGPTTQTKAERRANDALQSCHWTISLLKRWLLGTHAGAVRDKHLQAYLDEFAFRHNRRKTNGTVRIAARRPAGPSGKSHRVPCRLRIYSAEYRRQIAKWRLLQAR